MPVDEWALKNLFNPLHFEYVSWGEDARRDILSAAAVFL